MAIITLTIGQTMAVQIETGQLLQEAAARRSQQYMQAQVQVQTRAPVQLQIHQLPNQRSALQPQTIAETQSLVTILHSGRMDSRYNQDSHHRHSLSAMAKPIR